MYLSYNYYVHRNIVKCDQGYFILEMNNLHNVFDTLEEIYFGDKENEEIKDEDVKVDWAENKVRKDW